MHLASPVALGAFGSSLARSMGLPAVAVYQTDLPAYARAYRLSAATEAFAWLWLRSIHNAAQRTLAEARERYDSALADARAQAAAIKDKARADAQRIREDMRAETDREVEEIHRRGAEELAEQRARALQELRGQIGGLATDLAGRILGRPVGHHDETVQRLLSELDERQTAGGHR